MRRADSTRTRGTYHAVQFHTDERSVVRSAASFLAEGLVTGQPAVLVVSPTRRDAIMQGLKNLGLSKDLLLPTQLHVFDRTDALASFMVDGAIDSTRVNQGANAMMQRALGGRTAGRIRAYGEIADLLWETGRAEDAIRLEQIWNQMARAYDIDVLCGYSAGHFSKPAHARLRMQSVCDLHTHVIPFPQPLTA